VLLRHPKLCTAYRRHCYCACCCCGVVFLSARSELQSTLRHGTKKLIVHVPVHICWTSRGSRGCSKSQCRTPRCGKHDLCDTKLVQISVNPLHLKQQSKRTIAKSSTLKKGQGTGAGAPCPFFQGAGARVGSATLAGQLQLALKSLVPCADQSTTRHTKCQVR